MKQLPWKEDAEQAVLGGIMLDNSKLAEVADWLKPSDFYRRDHQVIYQTMLDHAGEPFDAITMTDYCGDRIDPVYIVELIGTTPSAANVAGWAEFVKAASVQRELIRIGKEVVDRGYTPGGMDVPQIAAAASVQLLELTNVRKGDLRTMKDVGRSWHEKLRARYENPDATAGMQTPWSGLNRKIGGMQPGDLVVVAGRPSMGKSAWAVNMATSAALREGAGQVLYFSLEMTAEALFNRAIAACGSIPLQWLRSPCDDGESEFYWASATQWTSRLLQSQLKIDETMGITMAQLRARVMRAAMRGKVDLVIVDHINIIGKTGKDPVQAMAEISMGLKGLAKEIGCPVIALSQLNRAVESRNVKKPQPSDLRESGTVEQDADTIVLLYRDDYYAEKEGRQSTAPGQVEMIVAKQREGETGTCYGRDELSYGRIADMDSFDRPTGKAVGGF